MNNKVYASALLSIFICIAVYGCGSAVSNAFRRFISRSTIHKPRPTPIRPKSLKPFLEKLSATELKAEAEKSVVTYRQGRWHRVDEYGNTISKKKISELGLSNPPIIEGDVTAEIHRQLAKNNVHFYFTSKNVFIKAHNTEYKVVLIHSNDDNMMKHLWGLSDDVQLGKLRSELDLLVRNPQVHKVSNALELDFLQYTYEHPAQNLFHHHPNRSVLLVYNNSKHHQGLWGKSPSELGLTNIITCNSSTATATTNIHSTGYLRVRPLVEAMNEILINGLEKSNGMEMLSDFAAKYAALVAKSQREQIVIALSGGSATAGTMTLIAHLASETKNETQDEKLRNDNHGNN